jgi:hypothetical protein
MIPSAYPHPLMCSPYVYIIAISSACRGRAIPP